MAQLTAKGSQVNEIDFTTIDKLVELGASGADILAMWKSQEEKRRAILKAESPRDRLFRDGLLKLINMTGRAPQACRSFLGKCLKAANDDPLIVLAAIDDAEERKVADAPAWIAGRLKKRREADVVHPEELDWEAVINSYMRFGIWSRWAGPDPQSPACRCPKELLVKHGIAA